MSEDLRRCFSCKELFSLFSKGAVKYEDIFCCTLACFTEIQETPMFKVTGKLRKENLEKTQENLEMQEKIQELENGSNPAQLTIDLEDNEVNFPPKISQQQVIKFEISSSKK